MTGCPSKTPSEGLEWETYVSSIRLSPVSPGEVSDVAERRERAESLRLTQLALGLEVEDFHLPQLAHWVHTGRELPSAVALDGPDAARWEPGEGSG